MEKKRGFGTVLAVIIALIVGVAGTFLLVMSSPSVLERLGLFRGKIEAVIEGEEEDIPEIPTIPEKEESQHVFYDTSPPTFIAAVNNGLLVIRGEDDLSGIKSYVINGFEFTDIVDGWLDLRLQQFDGGYKSFVIKAIDNVGNESEAFVVDNPYYVDPNSTGTSNKNPAENLPITAEPTDPTEAQAEVTEHMTILLAAPAEESQRMAMPVNVTAPAVVTESTEEGTIDEPAQDDSSAPPQEISIEESVSETRRETVVAGDEERMKEFYTIQTKNGKKFYMVIDRNGNSETAYFLTEISENDLLNATSDTKDNLPMNSAAAGNSSITESALPSTQSGISKDPDNEKKEDTGDSKEKLEESIKADQKGGVSTYLVIGIIGVVIVLVYYFKVVKPKRAKAPDEEDEDDSYDEDETEETEETEDSEE